jgi:ParB family chromosome partitioning protein
LPIKKKEIGDFLPQVAVDDIAPNDYNTNVMSPDSYRHLVEDMRENGPSAINPILLRKAGKELRKVGKRFEIIDGFNRWKAANELAWKTIPAEIREVSLGEAKVINYRKNSERGTIDPFREAELFKSEIDAGRTQEEVAKRYGIDRSQVSYRLSLLKISGRARRFIDLTRVTPSQLEVIAKVVRSADQELLAKEVRDKGLGVRKLELRAASMHRLRPIRAKRLEDCKLKMLVDMVANAYAECEDCKIRGPCSDIMAKLKKYRKKK